MYFDYTTKHKEGSYNICKSKSKDNFYFSFFSSTEYICTVFRAVLQEVFDLVVKLSIH